MCRISVLCFFSRMKPAAMKKFSTSHSSPLPPSEPGAPKRSVPGPTSPWHFLDLLLFSTLRRPMFINPAIKAGVYLCLAAGVSLVFDFVRAPPTYFSNKQNPFNRYFVKLGWAWTCGCLAAFIIVSSFVYTAGNIKLMRGHILRLVVGSGCWYTVTGLINLIHDWSGHCHPSSVTLPNGLRPNQRISCHRAGGVWLGFDISGHCFLLIMSNLWIIEELGCMQHWNKLSEILQLHKSNEPNQSTNTSGIRHVSEQELNIMRSAYRRLTTMIRLIFSFTACLSMLWDIMFLSTVIYFHTMPSKLLGTALGVACWFLFYRVIFRSCPTGYWGGFAPGLPGDGPIKFVLN
ncbi:unnamed protein product [Schistosoma margrebowiei]|uniref:Uncharacterized protein n=2 Tax=Schistosoma margrebowiei TaxID=48269 RepID=A0A183N240_9TREM|nr:unnamed protein product [Schistosoma margrebowiei]